MEWINTNRSEFSIDNEESFILFTEEEGSQAIRVAYRWTRDPHVSEDLVQEAFLRAWRSRTAVTDNRRAWVFKILWNVFLGYQKRIEYHHEINLEDDTSIPGFRESYGTTEMDP